jgi:hypothetical protein
MPPKSWNIEVKANVHCQTTAGYTHSESYAVNKYMEEDMVTTVIAMVSDTMRSQRAEQNLRGDVCYHGHLTVITRNEP